VTPSKVVHDWYAVKLTRAALVEDLGEADADRCIEAGTHWLEDTCASGTYDDFGRSVWFDTAEDARGALAAAEMDLVEHQLVRLRVNPDGGNHYLMEDVAWPSATA